MHILLLFVGWCLLLAVSWPLALAALVLAPFVLLLSLPFILCGIVFGALFAFVRGVLMLPARLLGVRS